MCIRDSKTGIGEFIRRTSIDEFPQFYSVASNVKLNKYNFTNKSKLACLLYTSIEKKGDRDIIGSTKKTYDN